MSKEYIPITVAYGDGIGPEIMEAVILILKEAGVPIRPEIIEVGEKLYNRGYTSGIAEATWESIARTGVLLKSPITTPQGGGYKSLNVTMRKTLGLYANIRPSISYHPYIHTLYPKLDLVIIRENEEDLYAGIEYRQTHNMYESLKLISRTGCEKIIRFAFDYAIANNRQKVTCLSKDNIMKFSDGIFHKVFDAVALEYPNIKAQHYIIDIGTALIATKPEEFDVIVTSNLYGDIISDVASAVSGSVGLAGSCNIGDGVAMFEAVHGSAPSIAGQDVANPSGLLNAAVMMLVHLNLTDEANLIENAWKKTLELGFHTQDIYNEHSSNKLVGTKEFAYSIIANLGQVPSSLPKANYINKKSNNAVNYDYQIDNNLIKTLVGADIFFNIQTDSAAEIAVILLKILPINLELNSISSKGLKLWPGNDEYKRISDHWCARFLSKAPIEHGLILLLLNKITELNLDFIKVINLYNFGTEHGYSLAQGE